ncbi:hypothetical protein ABN028_34720 [Actinopolymorpha sp. B17G11]|uniref:hypothetical protein n=1 Tax=Actinopolymorpha sp. B17G11 TaxID=3160861 RepID=UPI0032E3EFD8
MPARIEWWPEHGSGQMWVDRVAVESASLLPEELASRVIAWNDAFVDEDMLPIDGPGDAVWLAEGKQLLASVREALSESHKIVVTEPWWG